VVLSFRSSARLATAYGVAVTGTFLITSVLFLVVARTLWRWPTWRLVLVAVVFGGIELTYFAANLTKVTHGGWLTLLIAVIVFTVMLTWQRGRQLVTARRAEKEGPLLDFIDQVRAENVVRVPGTAVFPHPNKDTVPLALRANVAHNHVLHDHIVLITGRTANIPHIPWERRITVDHLGDPDDGIVHILAEFGFQDATDFPEVLRRVANRYPETDLDPEDASYFVSRIRPRRSDRPGMSGWRKRLFVALAQNAPSQTENLYLPEEQTIVVTGEVPV
jgi:KUP system potassium uptake protein